MALRILDHSNVPKKAMVIVEEAAHTASNLIVDKEFFMATMCEVLNDVARFAGVEVPTRDEAEQIHASIQCTIHFGGDCDSYMTCSAEKGEIYISKAVRSKSFARINNQRLISLVLILNSGFMSCRRSATDPQAQGLALRKSTGINCSSPRSF